jgi:uncharacterized protein YegP (UPF0339 family)
MAGKFVLKKTRAGNFVFNLVASNGQNILTSESYKSKRAALNGVESVRKNAGKKTNYEERMGKNKKPYFVLMAANKEIIGQSEMYASTTNMRNGMASVKSNARSAALEDTTVKK